MRDPFPTVSEGAISDWVGSRSFERGRSYFKSGAILDPRLQGNTLKAWCQGSRPQPYHLWVVCGTEGIKEAHCSCPVGLGGRCKHVAALLLTWSDQPDSFREVEELDIEPGATQQVGTDCPHQANGGSSSQLGVPTGGDSARRWSEQAFGQPGKLPSAGSVRLPKRI